MKQGVLRECSTPRPASLSCCKALTFPHDVGCLAGTVPTKFASALVETPEMEEANKNRTFLKRLGTPQVWNRLFLDSSLLRVLVPQATLGV